MSEPVRGVVRRIWDETPHLKGVVLEVDARTAQAYDKAGQYVAFRPDEETQFFSAIASAPGEAHAFELLLGPGITERLDLALGQPTSILPPMGDGFPIEKARGKDVVLFSVGSGISAIRACIEVIRADRSAFGKVALYHGARTEAEHAYRGHDAAWTADGIEIHRTVSRPWVQELFAARSLYVKDAVAFVAGLPAMIEGVQAIFEPERVFTNY